MNSISLISGAFPVGLGVLGGLSLVWLAWGGRRQVLVVPAAAAAAALLTLLLYVLAETVFHWWNASLPRILYVYAGAGILAAILAVVRLKAAQDVWSRLLTLAAAGLVMAAVAGATNAAYGQYPTLGSLLFPPAAESSGLPERSPEDSAAGLPDTTETNWTPPEGMPAGGRVYSADIPGTVSGYAANPALIYVPPAYLASPPAVNLPVLVLIHGQPGEPSDWLIGGQLLEVMDAFAAAHDGLAPVVVMPDASNANNRNWPLCLDSTVSSSATYLAVDLPAWVQQHLASGLRGGPQWAVAGYSYGGTCALQLATNFPAAYPTFVDIAGEAEPSIPQGRDALIQTYFAGDAAAFAAQNPLDRLQHQSFPDSAGIVVVGADDSVYAPQGRTVYAAARAAGMDVTLQVVPGAHSWHVWKAGLVNNLDWLGRRLGILVS